MMWGDGTARRTAFSPSDAVSAENMFSGVQSYVSNALVLFGDLKNAESPLGNRSCQEGFVSASYRFALPVLPRQLHLVGVGYLDPKYGGKRRFLHDFFV